MRFYGELKEAKRKYRSIYEERKTVATEYEFISKLVDASRVKLLSKFEDWYAKTYTPEDIKQMQQQEEEDKLDEGELFDKLELERMRQEDPDSESFYRAQKILRQRRGFRKR